MNALASPPRLGRAGLSCALVLLLAGCSQDSAGPVGDDVALPRGATAPAAPEFTIPSGTVVRLVPADGRETPVLWSLASAVGSPEQGAYIDESARLHAEAPGRYLVLGRRGRLTGAAYVTVGGDGAAPGALAVPLASSLLSLTAEQFWIESSPDTVALAPGATAQLSVFGFSEDGSRWTIRPVWSADAGAVSEAGAYTAPTAPGTYHVAVTRYGDIQTDTTVVRVGDGTAAPAGDTGGDTTAASPLPPPTEGTAPAPFTHAPSGGNWVTVRNAPLDKLPYNWRAADNGSGMHYYVESDLANVTLRTDASGEPASAPSALRTTLPAGWTGGGGAMSRWEMRGFPANDGRMYIGYTLRPSANWWHPRSNTGWKNFYFRPAGGDLNSIHFFAWVDAGDHGPGTMLPKLGTQWGGKAADEAWNNEEFAKRIRPGEWNVVELLITPNGDGRYDGALEVWVNGQPLPMRNPARGAGINWFLAGQPVGWSGIWFDMVFAHPGAVPPAEQWLEQGHFLVKVHARP